VNPLRWLEWRILWRAFHNLLVAIGGIAIAAWMANQSRPWPLAASLVWLGLILAVLYGIELGREQRVLFRDPRTGAARRGDF